MSSCLSLTSPAENGTLSVTRFRRPPEILTHIHFGQWVSHNKNKSIDPLARRTRHPRGSKLLLSMTLNSIDSGSQLITFIPSTLFPSTLFLSHLTTSLTHQTSTGPFEFRSEFVPRGFIPFKFLSSAFVLKFISRENCFINSVYVLDGIFPS